MQIRASFIIGLAFLGAFLFLFFLKPIEIEDVWWHLKTGEWIVQNAQVPTEDIFAFDEEITQGISPQWMGSTLYYLVYKMGGLLGLKIFRTILFTTCIFLFIFFSYRKIPLSLLALLTVCLVCSFSTRALLRPFVFNFIFIQLFLIVLFSYYRQGQFRLLLWLPFMGIIWANIHMGSFVYGNLFLVLFLIAEAVAFFNNQWGPRLKERRHLILSRLKHLSCILLFYQTVFFLGPYGFEGGLYPYKTFLFPEFINFYKLSNVIVELRPPIYIFHLSGFWFYVLVVLGLLFIRKNNKDQFLFALLFIFSIFLFLRGARASGLFALVTCYVIVQIAYNVGLRNHWRDLKIAKFFGPLSYVFVSLLVVVSMVKVTQARIYNKGEMSSLLSQSVSPYNPQTAIDFLEQNNIKGQIFNSAGLGGYLIWSSYPELKPFVDNRQYNQKLFAKYVAILREPRKYWPVAVEEFQLQTVLLDASHRGSHKLLKTIHADSKWQMIFLDGPMVVFVKKGYFALPENVERFEEKLQTVSYDDADIQKLERVIQYSDASMFQELIHPAPRYNEYLEEGVTLFDLGYHGEGIQRLHLGFQVSKDQRAKQIATSALNFLR